MLDDLWLLWELVLLGEPLVVMAPEPGICSESVVALIDLINPVSEPDPNDGAWCTGYSFNPPMAFRYLTVETIDLTLPSKIQIFGPL